MKNKLNHLGRAVLIFVILGGCLFGQATFKDRQDLYPRVRQARDNTKSAIDSLFNSAGIKYPPRRILPTSPPVPAGDLLSSMITFMTPPAPP